MTNIDQAHANSLLAYSLGNGAGTPVATTGNLHLRLMTVNGTATANGTELPTGGSYTQGTGITPISLTAATSGTVSNAAQLSQANMPAATITGGELWDSSSTPHRLWFGPLTAPKTMNAGDTLTVAAGALVLTLG